MQIVNANNRKEQVFINYGKDTVNPITLPKMPIINHYTFRVGNGEGELEQLFHKITTATKAYPEGTNNYVKQDDLVYNQPYCFVEVIITQLPPSDRPKCYMLHNQYVFRCNFSIRKDESLSSNPTVYFCDKLFSRGTFQGKDFEIKDNYIIASSCITKEQIWDESENKFSDLCFRTRISFEIDGVDFMPENFDVLPPLDYKENDNKVYELTKFKRRELLMFKLMGSDSVVIRNSCMKLRSSDVTNIIIYNVKHALIENCNLANENCFDPEIGLNEKYPDVKPGFNRDGGILWFYGDSENVTVRNNIFYKWGNDEALTFYGMNYFYGYIRRNVHVTGNTFIYGKEVNSDNESYGLDVLIEGVGGYLNKPISYTQFENFVIENNHIVLNDKIKEVVSIGAGEDGSICELENVVFRKNRIEHNWRYNRDEIKNEQNKVIDSVQYSVADFVVHTRSLNRDFYTVPAVIFESNELICKERLKSTQGQGHAILGAKHGCAELIDNVADGSLIVLAEGDGAPKNIYLCRLSFGDFGLVAKGNRVNRIGMLARTEDNETQVCQFDMILENNDFVGKTSSYINRPHDCNLTFVRNRIKSNSCDTIAVLVLEHLDEDYNINFKCNLWSTNNDYQLCDNFFDPIDNIYVPMKLISNNFNSIVTTFDKYKIGYGIFMHNNIIDTKGIGTDLKLPLEYAGGQNCCNFIGLNDIYSNPQEI